MVQAPRIYKNSKLVKTYTVCVHQQPADWPMLATGDIKPLEFDVRDFKSGDALTVWSLAELRD